MTEELKVLRLLFESFNGGFLWTITSERFQLVATRMSYRGLCIREIGSNQYNVKYRITLFGVLKLAESGLIYKLSDDDPMSSS